jgi:glucose-6-phosphate 1-dehydrogenase
MTFVLFGATGDLAKRKIFSALYNLFLDEKIPGSISIIGSGIEEISDIDFQNQVRQSVETFSRRLINNHSKIEDFISSFCYKSLDATNNEDYKDLLELVQRREEELRIPENRMFYLSVAPDFFDLIALNIKESGLGSTKGWKRLIICARLK